MHWQLLTGANSIFNSHRFVTRLQTSLFMDEEVLILQGRLTQDRCSAAGFLGVVNYKEPRCASTLGLRETKTRHSLPPVNGAKILYFFPLTPDSCPQKGQQLYCTPLIMANKLMPSLRYCRKSCSGGQQCGHMHTRMCIRAQPHVPCSWWSGCH